MQEETEKEKLTTYYPKILHIPHVRNSEFSSELINCKGDKRVILPESSDYVHCLPVNEHVLEMWVMYLKGMFVKSQNFN